MHRQPEHVIQYMFAEMGTSGSVDGSGRLVIKGRFQQKQIEHVLRRYIGTPPSARVLPPLQTTHLLIGVALLQLSTLRARRVSRLTLSSRRRIVYSSCRASRADPGGPSTQSRPVSRRRSGREAKSRTRLAEASHRAVLYTFRHRIVSYARYGCTPSEHVSRLLSSYRFVGAATA